MKFINGYIKFIDGLNTKLGVITSWLTFVLVLVTCYDVFTRYVLNESSIALQELEWHLFAVIFLMAAAYTLIKDDHVRVDVFYSRFSERKKAWVNFLGAVIFLIPFCILAIYTSKDFVINSFLFKETSPDAGGLPARYILKSFIPISFLFLLLQGISLAFKSFIEIKNNRGTTENK
jgi:TRAP-type mannitol/chloroaromatic compound transport system permease small subunit